MKVKHCWDAIKSRCGSWRKRVGVKSWPEARAVELDRLFHKRGYAGSHNRDYRLHIPPGYCEGEPSPLVVVLHGCKQTQLDIQRISGFDTIADRENVIVVYPFVTHYYDIRGKYCWGWWRLRHNSPGQGEVEDIRQIVEEVITDFSVDKDRVYIAGLSSGAGMAVAALTVHPGFFAAGAAVAGVAYRETPRAVISLPFSDHHFKSVDELVQAIESVRPDLQPLPPLMAVHSYDDEVVPIQAAENLRDAWLQYTAGAEPWLTSCREGLTLGIPWDLTTYSTINNELFVETLLMNGVGHGWYGGQPGDYSYPLAPNVSEKIWDFFKKHARHTTLVELEHEVED